MRFLQKVTTTLLLHQSTPLASFQTFSRHHNPTPTGYLRRHQLYMSIPSPLDTLTSGFASIARLPYGVTVSDEARTVAQPSDMSPFRLVELYDVENSNPCRLVRERITELDLVVERVIPSAENSRVFRDSSYAFSLPSEGTSLPRLVVANEGEDKVLMGAKDIVSFLDDTFKSQNQVDPSNESDELKKTAMFVLKELGSFIASLLRFGRGMTVSPAAAVDSAVSRPEKSLILYSYEGNQFCRLVREVLTELDLVYELRSAGKGSPRRAELASITGGSSQCPFLIDPNTNTKMPESVDIVKYLYKTYALWTPPSEILEMAASIITPIFKPLFASLAPLQAGSYREDKDEYEAEIADARAQIESEIADNSVVVYTYSLSPFCKEAVAILDNLDIPYNEITLGKEWVPGLISKGGTAKRVALLNMTGQSSLPHIFIGGKSIGGLSTGTPGLLPILEQGTLQELVDEAKEGALDLGAPTSRRSFE